MANAALLASSSARPLAAAALRDRRLFRPALRRLLLLRGGPRGGHARALRLLAHRHREARVDLAKDTNEK